jgi:hypothetical protein
MLCVISQREIEWGALAGIQRLGSSLSTAKVGGLKNHARTEKKNSFHALQFMPW